MKMKREVQKSIKPKEIAKEEKAGNKEENTEEKNNKKNEPIAYELAKKQRDIGVAEFFARNRHLLGFDNKKKALMTTIKEAVDNSLDACEEAGILPEVNVEVIDMGNERFRVIVEDNGPGIVKKQIPMVFARLLYGSKFFKLSQSLTGDEPIIIKKDNKMGILPIGKLVDSYLTDNEEVRNVEHLNIEVPAFDKKTYSYKFRKVSHLIKHRRQNEIIKITFATNRVIKITGCHSLFAEENGAIKEVEARKLKLGDKIVVPSKIPEPQELVEDINILDYIDLDDIRNNWLYVYDIPDDVLKRVKDSSKIIHKKTSKSRRFYRIKGVDMLDDSFKQYESKNFLPLHLVLRLGLVHKVKDCIIKTYYHGKETKVPVTFPLTEGFIKFLGLFIAEGHYDRRQIGLTFGKHEHNLIMEIVEFAKSFGLNFSLENRETSIRIKLFGNIFTKLIKNICGKGAKDKHIPEFIFRVNSFLRQEFIDALYIGDGHNTKGRNQLMLTTTSLRLANEVMYLWLMQGILVSIHKRISFGLGKNPTLCYSINVYGKDIERSNYFSCNIPAGPKKISQQLLKTDLSLLKIKKIEIIEEGYENVYDLSVPECENFVGGFGGVSCHNSRGQQGIGISASVLYGQLTTGRAAKITSKVGKNEPAHYFELHIDTQKNRPDIIKDEIVEWNKEHGIKIEIDLEGSYQAGSQSVDQYLKQTAIVNPHVTIIYTNPKAEQIIFPRASNDMPAKPCEIKPHPYGVELGNLMNMLKFTEARTLQSFLTNEFSRVGSGTAKQICENAALLPNTKPADMGREMVEKLMEGIKKTRIISPPTDCISPIGEELLEKGLRKEINAEFYCAATRPPEVYRGNPFCIEVGLAYGGQQGSEEQINLIRFANRVPLLYQQGACASFKSVASTNWRPYGLSQSNGALPVGPLTIAIHIASVWVPFTSESKEAIAHYPEIIKEIKLALQECGRKLAVYIHKKRRIVDEGKKRDYIETYIPHVAQALKEILGYKDADEKKVEEMLAVILEKTRGKLEEIKKGSEDYEEELAFKKVEDSGEEEKNEKEGGEDE